MIDLTTKIVKAIKSLNYTTDKYNIQRDKLNCRATSLVQRLETFKDNLTEAQMEEFINLIAQASQKDNSSFYEVLRQADKDIITLVQDKGIFDNIQIETLEKVIKIAQPNLTFDEYDIMSDILALNKSLLTK